MTSTMKSRDILAELMSRASTIEEVEAFYDEIIDSGNSPRLPELLCLSRQEWTAWCHSVGFVELASWRSEGWPNICKICGREIDVIAFGWLAQEKDGGPHWLVHIPCLP
jgi:hypothetical protein